MSTPEKKPKVEIGTIAAIAAVVVAFFALKPIFFHDTSGGANPPTPGNGSSSQSRTQPVSPANDSAQQLSDAQLSDAKQLCIGAIMYSNDYDDHFPSFSDPPQLVQQLSPYVKVVNGHAFADLVATFDWNSALSSRLTTSVTNPGATWLLKSKNPDPLNLFEVGFSDGHAKKVTQSDLNLIAQGIATPFRPESNPSPPANTMVASPQVSMARSNAAKSDLATLSSALQNFRLDNDRYPTAAEGLSALTTKPMGVSKWRGPYLTKPVGNDPWGHPYIYQSPGFNGSDSYLLESYGADGKPGGQGEDADIIMSSN